MKKTIDISDGMLELILYKFKRWLGVSWYEKDILPFEDDPEKVIETEGDLQ